MVGDSCRKVNGFMGKNMENGNVWEHLFEVFLSKIRWKLTKGKFWIGSGKSAFENLSRKWRYKQNNKVESL